jgi:hypothetical protein
MLTIINNPYLFITTSKRDYYHEIYHIYYCFCEFYIIIGSFTFTVTIGRKRPCASDGYRYERKTQHFGVVGIATGYGRGDRGITVRVPVGARIFTSPRRPDRLWGSPNLLSNGYRGHLSRG